MTSRRTAGSSILIPIPAGTVTGLPSTNTSRWACTWFVRNSFGWGFKPACTVRSIGSDGAAQTRPAVPDEGDAGTFALELRDGGVGDPAGAEPQPAAPSTRAAATTAARRTTLL